jgi:hypothetical protein
MFNALGALCGSAPNPFSTTYLVWAQCMVERRPGAPGALNNLSFNRRYA